MLHRKLEAIERALECATRGQWYRAQSETGFDPCQVVSQTLKGVVVVAETKEGETTDGAAQQRLDNARHIVNTDPCNVRKMLAIVKVQQAALEFVDESDTAKYLHEAVRNALAKADILADEMAVML